jgi:hypothetical protein
VAEVAEKREPQTCLGWTHSGEGSFNGKKVKCTVKFPIQTPANKQTEKTIKASGIPMEVYWMEEFEVSPNEIFIQERESVRSPLWEQAWNIPGPWDCHECEVYLCLIGAPVKIPRRAVAL